MFRGRRQPGGFPVPGGSPTRDACCIGGFRRCFNAVRWVAVAPDENRRITLGDCRRSGGFRALGNVLSCEAHPLAIHCFVAFRLRGLLPSGSARFVLDRSRRTGSSPGLFRALRLHFRLMLHVGRQDVAERLERGEVVVVVIEPVGTLNVALMNSLRNARRRSPSLTPGERKPL